MANGADPAVKAELRRRMRMVRDLVDDHTLRSVQLWAALAELPEYQRARTVMAFVGMKGEPDTDPLVARLAAEGRRLLLPRVEGDRIVAADADGPMLTSRFGVREPQGPAVEVSAIDLVVVPGLAFTPAGARLGYGGGFYDRFLPLVGAPHVGVCFAEQVLDDLPVEPHDVRVQRVVSA